MQTSSSQSVRRYRYRFQGLAIAALVCGAWALGLGTLLATQPTGLAAAVGVLVQTFLFTGLFITAHDAMHGTVAPAHPRLNHAIGAAAVTLYAGFSYKHLRSAHMEHHRAPAVPGADPDFHDGRRRHPVAWFLGFMFRYFTVKQFIVQNVVFNVIVHLFGVPWPSALLFWAVPAVLSSIQLFTFGTYLTHREPEGGHTTPHNAVSNDLPAWLSFLTCYHFGYHHEHHEVPSAPWWRLPAVRRAGV